MIVWFLGTRVLIHSPRIWRKCWLFALDSAHSIRLSYFPIYRLYFVFKLDVLFLVLRSCHVARLCDFYQLESNYFVSCSKSYLCWLEILLSFQLWSFLDHSSYNLHIRALNTQHAWKVRFWYQWPYAVYGPWGRGFYAIVQEIVFFNKMHENFQVTGKLNEINCSV